MCLLWLAGVTFSTLNYLKTLLLCSESEVLFDSNDIVVLGL